METKEKTVKLFNKKMTIRCKEVAMQKVCMCCVLLIIMVASYILSVYIPIRQLSYTEQSTVDFRVYLGENNFFETEYLGKGMQYIASLINYVDIDFEYNFSANEEIDLEYTYHIEANVKVFERGRPNHIIFERRERLLEDVLVREQNTGEFRIAENVRIDYKKYNNLIKGFKTEFNLLAESYLQVTLHVNVNSEEVNTANNMNITIPLAQKTINIERAYTEINSSGEGGTVRTGVNRMLRNASLIFAGLFVVMVINTNRFISRADVGKTPYQRRLEKILKNYDRVVVKLKKSISISENEEIIEVLDFEELLGMSDRLGKSILFMETDEKEKGWFIIKNGTEIYRYVLETI